MALSRRSSNRMHGTIWPGFVDALTGLLLVLMFVLTIFMVVQSVLRDTITGQATQLDDLTSQINSLAEALGLEQNRTADLQADLTDLRATLQLTEKTAQERQIQIGALQGQVAGLTRQTEEQAALVAGLQANVADLEGQKASLETTLAALRGERDAQTEAARLAAARREALEAMIAELRSRSEGAEAEVRDLTGALAASQTELSDAEAARLVEAEAAAALRKRLADSQSELDAMSLVLESERKQAEETLTLLAAARAAREGSEAELDELREARTASGQMAALLSEARKQLLDEKALSTKAQRQQEVLNRQLKALRTQLSELQNALGAARASDEAAQIQVESLGKDLNAALARAAVEERKRRELEEAERARLEGEKATLESYRSEFFGKLREILAGRDDIQIVGDRFVFGAEVLFPPGGDTLSAEGQQELAKVGETLRAIAADIPRDINWILRVDGHTDDTALLPGARFTDNWQLSQARALSVVRFMIETLGLPPNHLAANGFGQYQPLDPSDTPEARARNRRIEIKLTER